MTARAFSSERSPSCLRGSHLTVCAELCAAKASSGIELSRAIAFAVFVTKRLVRQLGLVKAFANFRHARIYANDSELVAAIAAKLLP